MTNQRKNVLNHAGIRQESGLSNNDTGGFHVRFRFQFRSYRISLALLPFSGMFSFPATCGKTGISIHPACLAANPVLPPAKLSPKNYPFDMK
jgi:hypothetical protein